MLNKVFFQHIMKTAGMSFHTILQNIYGIKYKRHRVYRDNFIQHDFDSIDCMSGHLMDLNFIKQNYPESKIITWFRDPIERLWSHYRYWNIGGDDLEPMHKEFRLKKPSFMTFAREWTPVTELWKKNMCGLSLNDFFFIGVVERWDEDFEKIKNLMKWPKTKKEIINKNRKGYYSPPINQKERDELKEILSFDYEMYKTVL